MAMFGNTFGVDPETQKAVSQYAAMPATSAQPAQDHKFFGKNGTGRAIAGYIGDYLAQLGGAQPLYAPAVQRQRDLADAQREQQAKLAQWVWQQQYAANNPEPTEQQKNYQYYSHLSPQEQAVYNQSRQGDPYVNTTLPNNQFYSGPASQLGTVLGGQSHVPQVSDEASYNALPAGASYMDPSGHIRTKGGTGGNVSGNFHQ